MQYICKENSVAIRKMNDNSYDYNLLAKWLSDPEVLEYYEGRNNSFDLDRVIKKFGPRIRGEELVTPCIIEYEEQAIGYIQYYKIDSEEYNVCGKIEINEYAMPYGMDLFIGETDFWNKGIGTNMLKALIQYLFVKENADDIDPQTWNKRAIKCYEKCGFKPITIIEKRELLDDEYRDNLIMMILSKDTLKG